MLPFKRDLAERQNIGAALRGTLGLLGTRAESRSGDHLFSTNSKSVLDHSFRPRKKPQACDYPGCERRFSRKSHLQRHKLLHEGQKQIRCAQADCKAEFYTKDKLKRHVEYVHGKKEEYFKCNYEDCGSTFKKRQAYKAHLTEHTKVLAFVCRKAECGMKFESVVKRNAHEKKHNGYPCTARDCQLVLPTWTKLLGHLETHTAEYKCDQCSKVFKKQDALRRHRRSHALKKRVLMCPKEDCKMCFTTIFNLQHHIRRHLQILKYSCYFPGCTKLFSMRESLIRHLVVHDPERKQLKLERGRPSVKWQKRLQNSRKNGRHMILVEDNLTRLFNQKLGFRPKPIVESDLSSLFNERKFRHPVSQEVYLKNLFEKRPAEVLEKSL
nr:PREDICTED: P43 5S RNA-binding protein-like [Latimeria chalumnae]|eukprot:XP_005998970.2 PREDICTED: P43 5S RNA-binding protein-like [Latimeria chalumnae]